MADPINLQSEMSDNTIVDCYGPLVAAMRDQMELALDHALAGVELDEAVLDHLAVAAARVAVEICPYCREQQTPCNCMREE